MSFPINKDPKFVTGAIEYAISNNVQKRRGKREENKVLGNSKIEMTHHVQNC